MSKEFAFEMQNILLEKALEEKDKEIERLNNILIEIKEIINNKYWFNWEFENDEVIKEVLEIISKEEVRNND